MDEIAWRILNFVARRGYIGATREDFFRDIPGVAYEKIEEGVLDLEKEGFVNVEWLSDSKFLVTITDKGSAQVKEEYEKRLKVYQERVAGQQSKVGLERI